MGSVASRQAIRWCWSALWFALDGNLGAEIWRRLIDVAVIVKTIVSGWQETVEMRPDVSCFTPSIAVIECH
ncbi:hypothetical protein B0J15DRAFT_505061 [Fusarium solani]|uniref:Secreted protein n=1 Tax=Fusarium solani TaxID=169388 RepID=A0A9P9JTC8_FUSSL|nr:uncharacterized protein B0J15DRAFT_505061 [Fusarium solani]KAH7232586.1 hypothetical protein B0J15DRAFT_505061 [Fusarium solani]